MVGFGDFQCPPCGRAFPTMKRLVQEYQGKVRFVFRDFPLPMHPQAPKAAEAGHCASEQGKFWEMHDRGTPPYQNLAEIVDEELQRATSAAGRGGDSKP